MKPPPQRLVRQPSRAGLSRAVTSTVAKSRKRFVNYALAMVLAMHMRNLICSLLLAAFVAALGYGLRALSHSMEFSSFMIFGVVTVAIMVSCGFAWDWLTGIPGTNHRHAATRDDNHGNP